MDRGVIGVAYAQVLPNFLEPPAASPPFRPLVQAVRPWAGMLAAWTAQAVGRGLVRQWRHSALGGAPARRGAGPHPPVADAEVGSGATGLRRPSRPPPVRASSRR